MKRNTSEYDFAGGITDTDATALLSAVQTFAQDAEAWVKANYPHLALTLEKSGTDRGGGAI